VSCVAREKEARIRSLSLKCHAKVIRNQPELFERFFEVIDDFLGDEASRER
jgi:hypothetical protein